MTATTGPLRAVRLPRAELEARLETARNQASEAHSIIAQAKAEAEKLRARTKQEQQAHEARIKEIADAELKRFIDTDTLKRNAEAAAEGLAAAQLVQERLEALTPWLTDLVVTCLQRVTGAMDTREVTARIVQTAVSDLATRERLTLRAAPDDIAQLEAIRAEMPTRFAGVAAIEPDAALKPGEMTLRGEGGIVTIGLAAQIAALRAHLEKASST